MRHRRLRRLRLKYSPGFDGHFEPTSPIYSDDEDEKENEIEPPHPLGFETPRTNWISDSEARSFLFSPTGKSTYALDFSDDSSEDEEEEDY